MTTISPRTSARAQFLLSKFKFQEVTEQQTRGPKVRNFMFFDYQLPPAFNLGEAIDQAIINENFEIFVAETDEVTAEQIHNIKFLMSLFVAVDPIRVEGKTHYHFHVNKMYEAAIGTDDASRVIAYIARYQPPTPITSFATFEEIYYALTVALRKGCDSPVTSALWNITQTLDTQTIKWLREPFVGLLKTRHEFTTYEAFQRAAKNVCLAHVPTNTKERAIHCLYRIFSDQDWEGYVSYLVKVD